MYILHLLLRLVLMLLGGILAVAIFLVGMQAVVFLMGVVGVTITSIAKWIARNS